MSREKKQVFANVWDAIADSSAEAANLELRYKLMEEISGIVKQNGWTQAEAAKRCGVPQPRINDLLRGGGRLKFGSRQREGSTGNPNCSDN
jgi:predicted XRE-type DNA-binding protein